MMRTSLEIGYSAIKETLASAFYIDKIPNIWLRAPPATSVGGAGKNFKRG
jgi:hypothetical protein